MCSGWIGQRGKDFGDKNSTKVEDIGLKQKNRVINATRMTRTTSAPHAGGGEGDDKVIAVNTTMSAKRRVRTKREAKRYGDVSGSIRLADGLGRTQLVAGWGRVRGGIGREGRARWGYCNTRLRKYPGTTLQKRLE